MKNIIYLILTSIFFSCTQEKNIQEQVVVNRIEYIYYLKTLINDEVWKGFSNKKFDLPLIYYTNSFCYIVNPTNKIISEFQSELIHESDLIKIYKTKLIDSIPFHMETSIDFSNDTTFYNYKSPIMRCSSVEITNQTIPDVNSTETWATMILHEYFHGFQFRHSKYQNHLKNNTTEFSQDSLKNIYKTNSWFQTLVDNENKLLIDAILSDNPMEINQLIDSVIITRDKRRNTAYKNLNIDISHESIYETMEGSARYIEYNLYNMFAQNRHDYKLIESDSSFHNYDSFINFNIKNEKWLYLTNQTTYYYATGFNIIRLLDKLNIDYKTRLFMEKELTLEGILKEYNNGRNTVYSK